MLVGQTGSGKTTLAEHLCRLRTWVVVLDPKGLIGWSGYRRYTTVSGAISAGRDGVQRLIYAPTFDELADWQEPGGAIDTFFAWVYGRYNCTLYVDETSAVSTATQWPRHLQACLQRGRERNVETWLATQRPSRIPAMVLTESEHVYAFKLRSRDDRQRVEEYADIPEDDIRTLRKHQFIYSPQDGDVLGAQSLGGQPLKLTL